MDSSGLGGAPAALDESNAFMGLGAPPSDGRQLDEDLMFLLNTDMINESLPSVSLPTGVPGAGSSVPVPELADSGDLSSPLGTGAVLGTAPVLPTAVPKPDSESRKFKAGRGRGRGRTSDKQGTDQDKRAKRLARNRESARQSRLRKKQHLELLEEKVSQLTTELDELARAHLARAEQELHGNMRRLLDSLKNLAQQPASSAEVDARLRSAVAALREKFGPDCQERRSVRDFHFEQLQRLLLPPHTKLMLYLIGQGDNFFEEKATDSNGIWAKLCHDVGLNSEQEEWLKQALKKERDTPNHVLDAKTLGMAAEFVHRFRKTMFDRAVDLQQQMNAMHAALTPAQSLRYLLWVEENRSRLQSGLGSSSARAPATSSPPSTTPTAAVASSASSGKALRATPISAGAGASVSALIGAARGSAAAAPASRNVQMLDQARLEDILMQKKPEDLTMADMQVLARQHSNP